MFPRGRTGQLGKKAEDCVRHGGETNNTGVAARSPLGKHAITGGTVRHESSYRITGSPEPNLLPPSRARGQKTDRAVSSAIPCRPESLSFSKHRR